jgi:hypothetical protein
MGSSSWEATRSDKQEVASCFLSETNEGTTNLGLSSPPYPKRHVCEPICPMKDPVSSPQYILAAAAAAAADAGSRRNGIHCILSLSVRVDGIAVLCRSIRMRL